MSETSKPHISPEVLVQWRENGLGEVVDVIEGLQEQLEAAEREADLLTERLEKRIDEDSVYRVYDEQVEANQKLGEALSWALDVLEISLKRIDAIDGDSLSPEHYEIRAAGLAKARAALASSGMRVRSREPRRASSEATAAHPVQKDALKKRPVVQRVVGTGSLPDRTERVFRSGRYVCEKCGYTDGHAVDCPSVLASDVPTPASRPS